MIKIDHTHDDGKICFILDRHYSNGGLYCMGFGKDEFIIAYRPYTGQYYAFDQITGKELATFSKEFYEHNIKNYKVKNLVPDPTCK